MHKSIIIVLLFMLAACTMERKEAIPTSSFAATNALPPTLTQAPLHPDTQAPASTPTEYATNQPAHPHITGISVGAPQQVLSRSGKSINLYGNLNNISDEHSTILPPGTVPGHKDYLFFITTMALTGGSGPDANGQWTFDFSKDYGLHDPQGDTGPTNGKVFGPPIQRIYCPTVDDATKQDPTFDLNYAASGSVVIDPTHPGPEELLMIYEGTNRCIGLKGGMTENTTDNFYSSIGVATSADYGRLWPIYRTNFTLSPTHDAAGPRAPETGAFGSLVCLGYKNCASSSSPSSSPNYGRYPVVSPTYTIKKAIASGTTISSTMGYQAPSAFVDDINTNSGTYVYSLQNFGCAENCPDSTNGLTISRAKLNGGTAPLKFMNWYNGSFNETKDPYPNKNCTPGKNCPYITNAGLGSDGGGLTSPIFPIDTTSSNSTKSFKSCVAITENGKPLQNHLMGSISYVAETREYLLIFLCGSPRDPALEPDDPHAKPPAGVDANRGEVLFYSTLDATQYDLSHQDKWSSPREIAGSWEWETSNNVKGSPSYCVNSQWYPSFMSLNTKPGYLSKNGYIFSLSGCLDGWAGRPREYTSRSFTIKVTLP